MPQTAESVEASIRKLGFKPEDIRLLLITHAHVDHAGATAHFKKLSGAKVAVMDSDFEHLKSGGKTDPVYGSAAPFNFPEVTAGHVLKDGDTVSLGNRMG
jgi:metallo-beta-lactamase class B